MGRNQLQGLEQTIANAAIDGCAGLNELLNKRWWDAVTMAESGDTTGLHSWVQDLRLVIRIVHPHTADRVQVVLKDPNIVQDLRTWIPEQPSETETPRHDMFVRWVEKLGSQARPIGEPGLILTFPLPHHRTPEADALFQMVTPEKRSGRNDLPHLLLWRTGAGAYDTDLALSIKAIQEWRFSSATPLTPLPGDRECSFLAQRPSVYEWYYRYRGFQRLGEVRTTHLPEGKNTRLPKPDRFDDEFWCWCQTQLWVPAKLKDTPNPLWRVGRQGQIEILRRGHFLVGNQNPGLIVIEDPLCWPAVIMHRPEEVVPALLHDRTNKLQHFGTRHNSTGALGVLHETPMPRKA